MVAYLQGWMKRSLAWFLVCLWCLLYVGCWGVALPGPAVSVRLQTETTIYAESADGHMLGYSSVYSSARADSDNCYASDVSSRIGQMYSGSYSVYRGFLSFDTSGIPDDATVTSAMLYVCASLDQSITDFELKVYRYGWSEALCSSQEANWDGAYGAGATLEGMLRNTSAGWNAGTYYSMTVAASGINVAGDTKYTVVSSRDVNANTPSGNEYVDYYTTDYTGTDKDPYLVVMYTTGETPTATATATPTETSTATPTETPSVTLTPTATPLCPVAITADTTWGPGAVYVGCNVGIEAGACLTITAGTQVYMTGDYHWDVWGRLWAVGTVSEPITLTQSYTVADHGTWGPIYVRHNGEAALEYVDILYGSGINDAGRAVITHCNMMSNTWGIATMGATEVTSCTIRCNTYGVLPYREGEPVIQSCNILDNYLYDVKMAQRRSVSIPGCWWGSDPPDAGNVYDYADDFTLGVVDQSGWASGWIAW